jgi:flagellar hook-length control protein FliK
VTVSLRVERGVVSAVLQADTAAARDWIRTHESELRQGLEGQGLHLDSLVVTEDGTPQGGQEQQAPPRKRPPMPATIGADAPRFEVRV